MRLSTLGWLRPRARVRVVVEKGDIWWAEAFRDGRAEKTRLGGGLLGFEARRGIWKAAARDRSTGLNFIVKVGMGLRSIESRSTCRARNFIACEHA